MPRTSSTLFRSTSQTKLSIHVDVNHGVRRLQFVSYPLCATVTANEVTGNGIGFDSVPRLFENFMITPRPDLRRPLFSSTYDDTVNL
jgi:hypothetical protein